MLPFARRAAAASWSSLPLARLRGGASISFAGLPSWASSPAAAAARFSSSPPPAPGNTAQGPVQYAGAALDEAAVRRVGERDAAMRAAYDRVPDAYPSHAQPDGPGDAPIDAHAAFRKRLLYRSKQRGW